MIQNYLTIAFRNLSKNRFVSALNLLGLSFSFACFGFLALYYNHETSFDRWIPRSEQVYRIAHEITNTTDGKVIVFATASAPLPAAISEFPQVETSVRLVQPLENEALVSNGAEKSFFEKGVCMADSTFFQVFPYPLLEGDPTSALNAPDALVVSEKAARKFFGTTQGILGKTLLVNGKNLRVTALMKNLPENTYLKADYIGSIGEFASQKNTSHWHTNIFTVFTRLRSDADPAGFASQIERIADGYVGDEIKENGQSYRYLLQPLTKLHLHSDFRYEWSKTVPASRVTLLGWVGLFILGLAVINFINLSTAQAKLRAAEVGIRKTFGAFRSQLTQQLLLEAVLMSALAFLGSLGLMTAGWAVYQQMSGLSLPLDVLWNLPTTAVGAIIALLTGLLAGLYPAISLSRFSPMEAIGRQKEKSGRQGGQFRRPLVVGQFAVSIVLLLTALIISRQLDFLKSRPLGFDQNQLLVVTSKGDNFLRENFRSLCLELARNSGIEQVTVSTSLPGKTLPNNLIELESDEMKKTDMRLLAVDEHFLETYDVPLVAGRNFSLGVVADSLGESVIINEAALPFFGWNTPEDALGGRFGGGWGTVVGVVRDFHFNSLQTAVTPLLMYSGARRFQYLSLRLAPGAIASEVVAQVRSDWQRLAPGRPFEATFLDETFNRQYQAEETLAGLFGAAASLAIFVACLGLFGLATFAAQRRTKEIGIRKVLGASVMSITGLLAADFLKLVIIAILIASPIAYYFMDKWLADFAYRIDIQWWMFVVAGAAAVAVSSFTVAIQSVRAALANPVKSLRNE
ncbi:MAG: ABC transporter permease [Saprospiraceae bacterium]